MTTQAATVPANKIAITIPVWIVAHLGEKRCLAIAQDTVKQCFRAGLSKSQAATCALLTLEAACDPA